MDRSTLIIFIWFALPIILFMGLNYILRRFSLKKYLKIRLVDIMVPILFLIENHIVQLLFKESVWPYLLISALVLGIGIAIVQAYFYDEIVYRFYLKMFWRFLFLLLVVLYVFLLFVAIF